MRSGFRRMFETRPSMALLLRMDTHIRMLLPACALWRCWNRGCQAARELRTFPGQVLPLIGKVSTRNLLEAFRVHGRIKGLVSAGLCRLSQASWCFGSREWRENGGGDVTQFGIIRKSALYAGNGPGTVTIRPLGPNLLACTRLL
jgi:hypothetical protein